MYNWKIHTYEIKPRKDGRGFDLISNALPFGRLWYGEPDAISNVVGHAKFFQPFTHDAVIRVYDEAGNVIEMSTRASSKSGERTAQGTKETASL